MRYIKIEDLLVFRSRWGQGDTLWKNSVLKKDFRDFFHNKCWYTEVLLVGQDVHIDHFRPKAAVKPFENFKYNHLIQDKGYYWLANDPSNYRACCIYANRKTGGGGKGNYFPLADDGVYQSEKDENNEHPMLLDPCVAEDVKLLSFLGNRVVPATDDELGKERVRVSAFIYNLTDAYISNERGKIWASIVEKEKTEVAVPYWSIVKSMQDTGEIYCDLGGDLTEQAIQKYNDCLDDWEKRQGYEIISDGNVACIAAYEASTIFILNKLLELSQIHNKGQKEVNERYLRNCDIAFSDPKKEEALKYAFVNSRVLLVYGAAGTGKTTLIDMISTMLSGRRKLFLTKTHTALQNLQRRINNPGADASFVSINSFTKRVNLPDYDVIFVDEYSNYACKRKAKNLLEF